MRYISFERVTSATITNIVLPWDRRVGGITRTLPKVEYRLRPGNGDAVRVEIPRFIVSGYPPAPATEPFSVTVTAHEWARIQAVHGMPYPEALTEASPDCGWGGYEWEDEDAQ